MKKILFFVAIGGFAVSFVAHLVALAGIEIKVAANVLFLLLFAVLFIVWLPTVIIVAQRQKEATLSISDRMNPVAMLRIWFDGAPEWLIAIAVVAFLYAGINFALSTSALNETQRSQIGIGGLRVMTGHFMAFYAIAAAVLCAAWKRGEQKRTA